MARGRGARERCKNILTERDLQAEKERRVRLMDCQGSMRTIHDFAKGQAARRECRLLQRRLDSICVLQGGLQGVVVRRDASNRWKHTEAAVAIQGMIRGCVSRNETKRKAQCALAVSVLQALIYGHDARVKAAEMEREIERERAVAEQRAWATSVIQGVLAGSVARTKAARLCACGDASVVLQAVVRGWALRRSVASIRKCLDEADQMQSKLAAGEWLVESTLHQGEQSQSTPHASPPAMGTSMEAAFSSSKLREPTSPDEVFDILKLQYSSVASFLDSLGLLQYKTAFDTHGISLHDVPLLTSDDLKELGMEFIGPRNRFLCAARGICVSWGSEGEEKP